MERHRRCVLEDENRLTGGAHVKGHPRVVSSVGGQRLVDPLTARRAVVHVLQFGNVGACPVVVREHQSGLASAGRSELNVGHLTREREGNVLPIPFAEHDVG